MHDHERIELQPGEDIAAWGHRTGRYPAERIEYYRAEILAERRGSRRLGQVTAARGAGGLTATEQLVRSLAPVLAPVWAALETQTPTQIIASLGTRPIGARPPAAGAVSAASETPLLDAENRKLFGPSREERNRELDLLAEANLREQLDEEARQITASAAISDEVFDQLFPPEKRKGSGNWWAGAE